MRRIYKTAVATMTKRANKYIVAVIASLMFFGCVYDFDPSEYWDYKEAVVIEGDIIIGDYSYFRVSKTDSLSASYNNIKYLENLRIWVEDEHGNKLYGNLKYNPSAQGYYHAVNTTDSDVAGKYKLGVDIPGYGVYESELMPVQIAPPIDSVSYSVAPDGVSLSVDVTTHDSDNKDILYCKWSFEEDWEFSNRYMPKIGYDMYSRTMFVLEDEQIFPTRYCWNKSGNNSVTVGSAERVADNIIYRKPITSIANTDLKISYLYSILVSQTALNKDGYIYWSTLQKNTNQTGGLFAPQPSELRGNIRSVNNPEESVLGYVNVSTVSRKRIFIECYNLGIYTASDCDARLVEKEGWPDAFRGELPYMFFINEAGYEDHTQAYWAKDFCVDCRTLGSKNKPSFWPNDHE